MSENAPTGGEANGIEGLDLPEFSLHQKHLATNNQPIYHQFRDLLLQLDKDIANRDGAEPVYLGKRARPLEHRKYFSLYPSSEASPIPRLLVQHKPHFIEKVVHDVFVVAAGDGIWDDETQRVLVMRQRYLGPPHQPTYINGHDTPPMLGETLTSWRRTARLIRYIKDL